MPASWPFGRGRPLPALRGLLAAATAAVLWDAGGSAHPGAIGVTWSGTVGRIVENRCASCHGAGGMARPRMDGYHQARLVADQIRQAALSPHMPRWYAAEGFGEFGNDPRLTSHEVEMLAQWADGRAPLGDPAVLQAPAAATAVASDEAPLSSAAGIRLSVAEKHRISAPSHTFELPTGLEDVRWIRGWKVEPGNPAFVTGAVLSLKSGPTLGTWAPGDADIALPDNVAYRLPAASTLLLTVYYRRPEGPAVDASSVRLYFTGRPRREVESMVVPCGSTRLARSIDVLAIRPPLSTAGRSLKVIARGRDRAMEPLAWFQEYPADHAQTYWFRDAVSLAAGTAIDVQAKSSTCRAELEFVPAGEPIAYTPVAEQASAVPAGTASEYWCPMHADVRASAQGTCDRCGMALVPMKPRVEGRYWLDAAPAPRAVRAGEPGTLRLVVREPGTRAVVRDFEMVHDRIFHLFVVSEDLREFSHVHPEAQPDGSLELPLTLARPGAYRLYADFLPVGGTPQMITRTLIVQGEKRAVADGGRKPAAAVEEPVDQGLRARMHLESGEIVAGVPSYVAFTLEDAATGLPVTDLQPFLGAWGHMFIVGADLSSAVHSHPTTSLENPGGPKIFFQQRFPRAGTYRMWVQFQRDGKVATLPFSVHVSDRRFTN
jgi:hypothetical protein